jgi:hypothetical protein
MATFIPGNTNVKRRRAAMQAALYAARQNRAERQQQQIDDGVVGQGSNVASPNPNVPNGEPT